MNDIDHNIQAVSAMDGHLRDTRIQLHIAQARLEDLFAKFEVLLEQERREKETLLLRIVMLTNEVGILREENQRLRDLAKNFPALKGAPES